MPKSTPRAATPASNPEGSTGFTFEETTVAGAGRANVDYPEALVTAVKQVETFHNQGKTDPAFADKGLTFTVPADEVQKYVNLLRRIGNQHTPDVSLIIRPETAKNDKDEDVATGKIAFRATNKIQRKAKDGETADATDNANADEAVTAAA